MRILQVVNDMHRAGLETMLMNYYRNIDRTKIQFDFLTHRPYKSDYDDEILSLGGRMYYAPRLYPQNYIQYFRWMDKFFEEHLEYQIMHSHIDSMSYLPLLAAKRANVPVRIAHSHNTSIDRDLKYPLKQLFRTRITKVANEYCACGEEAGKFLFGNRDFKVIPNAIETERFIYNVSRYLERCMESLLHQTYKNIEIIMVDDGSPDDCGKKCDRYAAEEPRIKVIHKKNAGLGRARNSGLEIAEGEYVMFIDSDDYTDVRMIERLYHRLTEEGADTCFCRYYDTSSEGKDELARETYLKQSYCGDETKKVLLGMIGSLPEQAGDVEIGMSVWKGLYSLDIIRDNGILFPSEREYISEDIIFHMQYLVKAKHIVIEGTANYHYCDNGASLTKSYKADRFQMEKVLLKKEVQELNQIFKKDEYAGRLYKAFLGRVRRCIAQEVNANPDKKSAGKNIKGICDDPLVQKILEEYDDRKLQKTKRMVNFLIRHRQVTALAVIFKIKNG